MRVRMLKGVASVRFSYRRGQVVELSGELADQWVRAGLAEPVEEEQKRDDKPRRRSRQR